MDQTNALICCFGCIGFIGLSIGIPSFIWGSKPTLHYIHENIFDEHMAINISMNIGLISLLLGIFFFTYATTVEENIVKGNAVVAVTDIMTTVSPLLNNTIRTQLSESLAPPDLKEEDEKAAASNKKLMHDAFSKLIIVLDVGLTIGFIICTIYKHSFLKMLGLNLIIVVLVGCTEFVFLNFLPNNFISIDTNFIRYTILSTLKEKIQINNVPIA
jgi:hypothetical protein